ncbi:hypothetical protein EXIGLDRAFT_752146 [Exidia glandulosa HHB12029]|uniref:DUF6533 domain-containing protein n=1 Tax=Exidia glandulosa HHB12029 TaxID=1314781 RepID=A0A165ET57_EXIGL|nr:hypothetical protein EXIGLDRAFT_752146 [Exidia glandulosa HHB12029]
MENTSLESELAPIMVGIQDLQSTKYVWVSALAILLYEYLITFEDERRWVWGRRVGGLQILFYLNRYLPIVWQIVNVVCFSLPGRFLTDQVSTAWLLIFVQIGMASQWSVAGLIVTYRVWALYQNSRVVKLGIVMAWVCANIGMIVFAVVSLSPDEVVAELAPSIIGRKICHGTKPLPLVILPALPTLIFDLIAFCLALWKLAQHSLLLRKLLGKGDGGVNTRVYHAMALDTTMYFVVMLASVSVLTAILESRESLRILWDPMVMVLGSVACSRMVMNLREVAGKPSMISTGALSHIFELQPIASVRRNAEHI